MDHLKKMSGITIWEEVLSRRRSKMTPTGRRTRQCYTFFRPLSMAFLIAGGASVVAAITEGFILAILRLASEVEPRDERRAHRRHARVRPFTHEREAPPARHAPRPHAVEHLPPRPSHVQRRRERGENDEVLQQRRPRLLAPLQEAVLPRLGRLAPRPALLVVVVAVGDGGSPHRRVLEQDCAAREHERHPKGKEDEIDEGVELVRRHLDTPPVFLLYHFVEQHLPPVAASDAKDVRRERGELRENGGSSSGGRGAARGVHELGENLGGAGGRA
mmetsp:Transcript_12242/g.40216  ORF Transcript_12242/g.40216 Transcript_12242/m.40216 type:complete len:274 (+) Transcript_12242:738-1559(+)